MLLHMYVDDTVWMIEFVGEHDISYRSYSLQSLIVCHVAESRDSRWFYCQDSVRVFTNDVLIVGTLTK